MNLKELVLLKERKDKEGNKRYVRLDTNQILLEGDIELLKEAPIILAQEPHTLNARIKIRYKGRNSNTNALDVANALLIGEKMQEQENDYYAASFCRMKDY